LGSRNRRTAIQGQPGQKLSRPYLKKRPGMVFHSCNPSYLGVEGGGWWSEASQSKRRTLPEKQIKEEGAILWNKW
jgi:hypothetical protein